MTVAKKIFHYEGWYSCLEFAADLGHTEAKNWEDIEDLDAVLDELEDDCLGFIKSKGYQVKGYDIEAL